jgi:hypothetical protein
MLSNIFEILINMSLSSAMKKSICLGLLLTYCFLAFNAPCVNAFASYGSRAEANPARLNSMDGSRNNPENETELSVHPNPASKQLYIQMGDNSGKATVSLYNITGEQVMKEEKEIQGTAIIRVDNLAQGIYILKVQTSSGSTLVEKVEIEK